MMDGPQEGWEPWAHDVMITFFHGAWELASTIDFFHVSSDACAHVKLAASS